MGSFVFTLSWLAFCCACIRMIERRPIPFAYLTDGSTYGASASRALEISYRVGSSRGRAANRCVCDQIVSRAEFAGVIRGRGRS